jgi:hypothetical protein
LSDAFIETTPHHLSVLCVRHAALIIRNTNTDPQLWFLAIPDLHRALNCAFVAALRGTAGVGAYPPKLRHQWLKYFEVSRSGNAPSPTSERVQNFTELLGQVRDASPDLLGDPLKLDVQQSEDLHKLNAHRARKAYRLVPRARRFTTYLSSGSDRAIAPLLVTLCLIALE